METMTTLQNRKSIRSYTGEKLPEETFKAVLKAAQASPVGMARYENVHLTIIEDEAMLKAIDKAAAQMFGDPESHPLYGAPTLILVSAKSANEGLDNVEFSNAAIIVHNMILAATDCGAGACHIWGAVRAINQSPELVASLNLPEGFAPCCAAALGKTDEVYTTREIPEDRIATNCFK